jgi:hypothetical protein
MGSSTDASALKVTNNPWDPSREAECPRRFCRGGGRGPRPSPSARHGGRCASRRHSAAWSPKAPRPAVSRFGPRPTSSLETIGVVATRPPRPLRFAPCGARSMDQTHRAHPGETPRAQVPGREKALSAPDWGALPSHGARHRRFIFRAASSARTSDAAEAAEAAPGAPSRLAGTGGGRRFALAVERLRDLAMSSWRWNFRASNTACPPTTPSRRRRRAPTGPLRRIRLRKRPDWAENRANHRQGARSRFGDE